MTTELADPAGRRRWVNRPGSVGGGAQATSDVEAAGRESRQCRSSSAGGRWPKGECSRAWLKQSHSAIPYAPRGDMTRPAPTMPPAAPSRPRGVGPPFKSSADHGDPRQAAGRVISDAAIGPATTSHPPASCQTRSLRRVVLSEPAPAAGKVAPPATGAQHEQDPFQRGSIIDPRTPTCSDKPV
jgi:hypothetical protein